MGKVEQEWIQAGFRSGNFAFYLEEEKVPSWFKDYGDFQVWLMRAPPGFDRMAAMLSPKFPDVAVFQIDCCLPPAQIDGAARQAYQDLLETLN